MVAYVNIRRWFCNLLIVGWSLVGDSCKKAILKGNVEPSKPEYTHEKLRSWRGGREISWGLKEWERTHAHDIVPNVSKVGIRCLQKIHKKAKHTTWTKTWNATPFFIARYGGARTNTNIPIIWQPMSKNNTHLYMEMEMENTQRLAYGYGWWWNVFLFLVFFLKKISCH